MSTRTFGRRGVREPQQKTEAESIVSVESAFNTAGLWTWRIAGGALIAFALIALAAGLITVVENAKNNSTSLAPISSPKPVGVHRTSCAPTMTQYMSLRDGMSVREAFKVMGCEGAELSRSSMTGYVTVSYGWDAAGSIGANTMLMFQNNALISRSQFGMR